MKFLSRMLKRFDRWGKGIGPFENYGASFMERTHLDEEIVNQALRDAEIAYKKPNHPDAEWLREEATRARGYFREMQLDQLRKPHNNDALRFEALAETVKQSLEGRRVNRNGAAEILKKKRKEFAARQAADFGR